MTEDGPSDADLCRAVSSAYYALFHRILREGADRLAGAVEGVPPPSWSLVYRAFNHGGMAERCGQVAAPPAPLRPHDFPASAQAVAAPFRSLQRDRHSADYDPVVTFEPEFVEGRISATADAIQLLEAMSPDDARLFVTFLLLGARR